MAFLLVVTVWLTLLVFVTSTPSDMLQMW